MAAEPAFAPSADPDPDAHCAAVVRALLDAFMAGDEAGLRALLHPDVEFVPMLVATGERPEPYRGHAGLIEYLRDTRALLLDIHIDIQSLRVDRDIVVVLGRVRGTAVGGALDVPTTYVFRVHDGLIIHGIVGSDPDRARIAFGLGDHDDASGAASEPALAPLQLHFAADADSVPAIRRAVDAFTGALGARDTLRHDICLAVSEACSNAVLHAYVDMPAAARPGSLDVRVWRVERMIHILVEDEGRGMVARVDSPGLGMGLVVMTRVAAACTITTRPERPAGCAIHLEFDADAPGSLAQAQTPVRLSAPGARPS